MMEESHAQKRLAVTAAIDVIAGNADLLSEILLRLPARSLIRFSVVCKRWCSLVTSAQFRLNHTLAFSSTVPPSGIYFYNCLTNLRKIDSLPVADNVTSLPPFPFPAQMNAKVGDPLIIREFKVTQSCNGLLMCVVSSKIDIGEIKLCFVYNPAKIGAHTLPSPYDKHYEVVYYYLIVDPSEPPYYKALCIKHLGGYFSDVDVSVYVTGCESWRSCCHFSPPYDMRFDSGVFWNGAIHWIGENFSVYFDANSEEIVRKIMPPRPQGTCSQKIRYFGEWGGHLHLIQIQSVYAKKFNVLELDKDTWKWSIRYRVHLARLISAFPEMVQKTSSGTQYAFSILSVMRGEKEEDSVLFLTIPGKVVAYNLVRKIAKVVRELPGEVGDTLRFNPTNAYHYTESLFSVREWSVGPK